MKVIVGLGNPGLRFKYSRHNLGFWVVEYLAQTRDIEINQKGFKSLIGQGVLAGEKVLLVKPLTFMNLSAEAVGPLVRQKKIELSELLVVCDDVNLPLGKIRLRAKGSDGGHKGLRSIINGLASSDFARLRIGVGAEHLKTAKPDLTEHVLGKFNKQEVKTIKAAAEEAAAVCLTWIKDGIGAAMNKFN